MKCAKLKVRIEDIEASSNNEALNKSTRVSSQSLVSSMGYVHVVPSLRGTLYVKSYKILDQVFERGCQKWVQIFG